MYRFKKKKKTALALHEQDEVIKAVSLTEQDDLRKVLVLIEQAEVIQAMKVSELMKAVVLIQAGVRKALVRT